MAITLQWIRKTEVRKNCSDLIYCLQNMQPGEKVSCNLPLCKSHAKPIIGTLVVHSKVLLAFFKLK